MKVKYIEKNGNRYKCEFSKRKNSKKLTLKVDGNGVVKISLPYYYPYLIAKTFILKNINWIDRKIDHLMIQRKKYYYLGNNIRFVKKNCTNYKSFNYIIGENEVVIEVCPNNLFTDRELYIKFLETKAIEYIPQRAKELSAKHGFEYNSVKIKNLSSRWGSCSSKKNLSFNLKLMYFDYTIIDYVIVHELCHLKEMNHSKEFWKLVEAIMPGYKRYKSQLNIINH